MRNFFAKLTLQHTRQKGSIQEISVPRYSRNIGAPLDATRFLNWVSKDVTLRRKRDAITGTASYCYDSWRKGGTKDGGGGWW